LGDPSASARFHIFRESLDIGIIPTSHEPLIGLADAVLTYTRHNREFCYCVTVKLD